MVIKILAWDYSGSTAGSTHYHSHGWNYLQKFAEENYKTEDQVFYVVWGDSCTPTTLSELQQICKTKAGRGGCTYPSKLVEWILSRKTKAAKDEEIELWLITDGEIPQFELKKCAELNVQLNYSKINFIVINKTQINLSVGASFFSGTQLNIFYDDQLKKKIDTSAPFNYDEITLENFEAKWDELSDFIQAKFMGSDLDSLQEVEKLSKLRRRLLDDLAKKNPNASTDTLNKFTGLKKDEIIEALKTCTFYRTLTNTHVKDLSTKIDGSVTKLISYIYNKHKSYDFTSLKMEYTQNKMPEVIPESEPELSELDEVENCNFYDAVTLQEETGAPILLINTTDLIQKYWVGKNYSTFRMILECPFMAQIDECIGHVYLVETFQALSENSTFGELVNPLTNQPIIGGLIFSEKADKWNDYVLTQTFFRGKKVNTNIRLWYYVIWKHAQKKEWIQPEVLEQLKTYAFRRLGDANVRLGMSGLSLDPEEVVPLPIACFYCTEGSSILFGEHPTLFLHERLRICNSVATQMLEILKHFGYDDIDVEFVQHRAKTFSIMKKLKRLSGIEKQYCLLELAFESNRNFLTTTVKDREILKYLNLIKYHHKDSVIPFNYAQNQVDIRPFTIACYDYDVKIDVKLCPETFRPYFVVRDEELGIVPYYKQILSCISAVELTPAGDISRNGKRVARLDRRKLLSICKYYVNMTNTSKKFPERDGFVEYVFKRTRLNENNQIRLFPTNVLELIQRMYDLYSSLDVTVEKFIEKTRASVTIEARIEMEKELNSECIDLDLPKFIADAKLCLTEK